MIVLRVKESKFIYILIHIFLGKGTGKGTAVPL